MWTYTVKTGVLQDRNSKFVSLGYSGGGGGTVPEAVNNPDYQHVKDVGPLPNGMYDIGEPEQHPRLGAYAIPLTPYPDNEMYGRGGFFIHGDNQHMNQSASDGCIILPYSVRVVLGAGTDKLLQVV